MAQETRETLKNILLFCFVAAGVGLILLIWIQGLSEANYSITAITRATPTTSHMISTPFPSTTPDRTPTTAASSSQDRGNKTPTLVPNGNSEPGMHTLFPTPDVTQVWIQEQTGQ